MQEAPHIPGLARFGVFEVDFRTHELRKRGLKMRLQEQPYQVLATLLDKPRELVTREELRNKLWPADTFVDFDQGLNKAINKIREALSDSAANPRFIETVARRGYRFIADVSVVGQAPVTQKPPAADLLNQRDDDQVELASEPAADNRVTSRLLLKIGGAVAVSALIIFVVWMSRSRNRPSPTIRSLAVLPMENLSGDASQDYFSDGMTDELIARLGQISALRVISRTSVMAYKGVHKPLPQIARELTVDAVVEGTVLRAGNKVRITAQLIQADSDKHLWADSYEGDLRDTLALQNRVARSIAEQIRTNLNAKEQAKLKAEDVVDPEAYEAYLKGRYFWNRRTADGLKRAIEYFNQAIAKDPSYAQAYTGLADSYALLGDWEYGVLAPKEAFPKAEAAARKAIELDSTLAEAHTSLAFSLDLFDWNWAAAEREYKLAIALNPGYATAHHWYAWHLIVLGRNAEGSAELRTAQSLDPLSLIISADMADALLIAHRFDESIQQSRKTVDMDPNFAVAHYGLGQAYVQTHMYNEAIAELQKAVELSGGDTTFLSSLACAYALSGRRDDAEKLLHNVENRSERGVSNAPGIALIYTKLNQNDEAMSWVQKAFDERFNPSVFLRPAFDSLRSDPRFQALLRHIGLNQ